MKITEKTCGIYSVTSIRDGKRLIGSSSNIYYRRARHKSDLKYNKHGNPHLQNAYNKYGKTNFIFELVQKCNEENLIELEDYYIKAFNTLDKKYGYNFNLASRRTQNEESRKKISAALKGKKLSKEHRLSISIGGKESWKNRNPKEIEDRNRKMSKSLTGRIFSKAHRQNISSSKIGVSLSEKHRRKISRALMNRIPWNKGKSYCHHKNNI